MDLSIVIISWNTKDVLRDCLVSVFDNLAGLDAEVIVVDNASSDGSDDMVAAEFPEAVLVRNKVNVGFAGANNDGFEVAKGEYILLLNSDTIVLGDVLKKSVEYMRAHGDVGVFGCRVLNPDRSMQRTCFQYPTILNSTIKAFGLQNLPWPPFFGREIMRDWQRDTERDVDVVTGCYFMVPRKALDEVGPMDASFFFNYDETDWCIRFRRHGWKVRFSPVGEIIHLGNVSGRKIGYKRDLHLVRGKIKLHRKHFGVLNAFAIWVLSFLFFVNRIVVLAVPAIFGVGRQRLRVSIEVLRRFPGFDFVLKSGDLRLNDLST